MLVWLSQWLSDYYSGFGVFNYLTLRAILAALTALGISLLLGPLLISKLHMHQVGQAIREDGPQSHLSKAGTPTMGGALILLAVFLSSLLWGKLDNVYLWITIGVTFVFACVGWVDDYRKVIEKNSRGLPAKWKYFWQSIAAIAAAVVLYRLADTDIATNFYLPFFKDPIFNLGWLFIPFVYFVVVGSSNAVNLTDGLDGLAIVPSVMVASALGLIAYLTGHAQFSDYLLIPYVPGAGELFIFCMAMAGAGLGFLWFNTYPAMVFMGDVGALAIGAALGIVAVIVRHEVLLFVMGGIFVLETVSVILQVASFKLTGKRIFRMAPIHHHYELKGWPEPRVIVRFWIISLILVLIGLATLKLR